MKRERINLPKTEGRGCFACGTANPDGLNLNFYRLGDSICTEISLSKNHEGWEGMAHGGIISTLLEETMSWAILFFKRVFFLTRGTTIKYIRSVLIKTPLIISAKVLDESSFPTIIVGAEIRDGQNRLLVRGKGEFLIMAREECASMSEEMCEEMSSLLKSFPPL